MLLQDSPSQDRTNTGGDIRTEMIQRILQIAVRICEPTLGFKVRINIDKEGKVALLIPLHFSEKFKTYLPEEELKLIKNTVEIFQYITSKLNPLTTFTLTLKLLSLSQRLLNKIKNLHPLSNDTPRHDPTPTSNESTIFFAPQRTPAPETTELSETPTLR